MRGFRRLALRRLAAGAIPALLAAFVVAGCSPAVVGPAGADVAWAQPRTVTASARIVERVIGTPT
jgi:hypothetical protein